MKRTLLFLAFILWSVSIPNGQEKEGGLGPMDLEGYWWKEQAIADRLAFLKGYMICAQQACDDLFMIQLMLKDEEDLKKKAPGLFNALDGHIRRYNLANITFGQLISGIDEIYADPANMRIPLTFFIRQMADYMQGEETKQGLEEWLTTCRKIVSK